MLTIFLLGVATLVALALVGHYALDLFNRYRNDEDRQMVLVTPQATGTPQVRPDGPDALVGEIVPAFALPTLNGERVSRDTLLASGKPLMLVFVEPRCGPCYELLPDLGGWQRMYGDLLQIAVFSSGDAQTNYAMTDQYGLQPVLLQEDNTLLNELGLVQEPAAIIVQPDGRISAGPRYGTRHIRQLVADTLGMELPDAPARTIIPARVGQAAPDLRLPDLDGNVVDLAAFRGAPLLLFFWSPGCSHCQSMLPAMRALEALSGRPRMLIVSRGPIALNKAMGLATPIVLDENREVAQRFGVEGTPSVAVIDEQGILRFPVTRGAQGVHALLSRIAEASPRAAD